MLREDFGTVQYQSLKILAGQKRMAYIPLQMQSLVTIFVLHAIPPHDEPNVLSPKINISHSASIRREVDED
jgi:hypothetical protein